MTEGFPPHYQRFFERYYRRLAEERPADDIPDEEGSASAAGRANMPEEPAAECRKADCTL